LERPPKPPPPEHLLTLSSPIGRNEATSNHHPRLFRLFAASLSSCAHPFSPVRTPRIIHCHSDDHNPAAVRAVIPNRQFAHSVPRIFSRKRRRKMERGSGEVEKWVWNGRRACGGGGVGDGI
jgi:hypothetical protein